MSKLIDFYNGEPNPKGRTLESIWEFDFLALENIHDYIQWLFPIIEPRYFTRDVPSLLTSDIRQFKNDKNLKRNLLISFLTMLNFYGLDGSVDDSRTFTVYKGENYEERRLCWQTGRNHNFLRITRILISLKLLGCEEISLAFYKCLMKLVEEDSAGFNFTSLMYWKDAVKELLIYALD